MTRSENTVSKEEYFQNESYIPQLFTRKFLPREPKCINGVAVGNSDGLTTREIAPIGATSRLCLMTIKPRLRPSWLPLR